MTLNDAIALYKSNDLTAKGALKIWVRIRFKTGWEGFIDTKELRELFDMRRSTFWEALGKLEEEGEIELSEPHKIHIKRLGDSSGIPDGVQNSGQVSGKPDECPENRTGVRNSGQVSGKPDDESLKPSQQAESSEPPDLIQDLYQSFINSLSEGERESFLEFGKKKAAQLPRPPELPLKWIESNFEELAAQWRKTPSGAATNSKWENDPRHQEWMDKIRSLGFGTFIYESGKRDKEREEFFRWANANNLIWGAES
ncbi:hypothetical protein B4U84_29740 [Westiellopsis prolifica IICB1]|nr:hypothetical protein B4U84_29740 [Westiellopsis prolifica IICB1]